MPLVRIDVIEGRSEEELRCLADVVQDVPEEVEPLLKTLEQDTASVEEASLLLLSAAWEDPNERERVRRAIRRCQTQVARD
jgi:hypothetical protein